MKVHVVPCSYDNYSYLLICPNTGKAAVVDPTEAYPLLEEMKRNDVQLTTIFCTHHHQDHIGDIDGLLGEYAGVEVVCHSSDKSRISLADFYVEDGDEVTFGEQMGDVIHTPGHTRGSVCYRFANHLFVGDTLFGAGCGRLFEGDARQMYGSLMEKISHLSDDINIYFGHEYTRKNLEFARMVEPDNRDVELRLADLADDGSLTSPTTLALEKRTNPFLRSEAEGIREFLKNRGEEGTDDPVQVFRLLRQMRNSF